MIPPPPRSTLFPYTTLFISNCSIYENNGTLHKLLELGVSFAEESRIELFEKLEKITLDLGEEADIINKLIQFVNSVRRIDIDKLQSKVVLARGTDEVYLSDLRPSISTLTLNQREIDFKKIFGTNDNDNIAGYFYNGFIEHSEVDKEFFIKLL